MFLFPHHHVLKVLRNRVNGKVGMNMPKIVRLSCPLYAFTVGHFHLLLAVKGNEQPSHFKRADTLYGLTRAKFLVPWNYLGPWVFHFSSDLMKLVNSMSSSDCSNHSRFYLRAGVSFSLATVLQACCRLCLVFTRWIPITVRNSPTSSPGVMVLRAMLPENQGRDISFEY